jgi:hypothetical protein
VRVLEAGHEEGFALETLAELGIGGNVIVHNLDHDLPPQIGLLGQIDPAHAAFAEKFDGLVPAQKDAPQHMD